jgi:hypothetical protein
MLKVLVTIILSLMIALVIFWPRIKQYVWLKISRRILDHLMGGKR